MSSFLNMIVWFLMQFHIPCKQQGHRGGDKGDNYLDSRMMLCEGINGNENIDMQGLLFKRQSHDYYSVQLHLSLQNPQRVVHELEARPQDKQGKHA